MEAWEVSYIKTTQEEGKLRIIARSAEEASEIAELHISQPDMPEYRHNYIESSVEYHRPAEDDENPQIDYEIEEVCPDERN
jgi:hypothetical protein